MRLDPRSLFPLWLDRRVSAPVTGMSPRISFENHGFLSSCLAKLPPHGSQVIDELSSEFQPRRWRCLMELDSQKVLYKKDLLPSETTTVCI